MKNFILCSALLFLVSIPAFADGGPNPCRKIHQQCKAAGFKSKDVHKNCTKPVMEGQTVPNVAVDPAMIQACKDMRKKSHQENRQDDHEDASE